MTLSGIADFFLGIGRLLATAILLFGGTALLVWPIWALAISQRALYTTLVGLACLGLILWSVQRGLHRRFMSHRGNRKIPKS